MDKKCKFHSSLSQWFHIDTRCQWSTYHLCVRRTLTMFMNSLIFAEHFQPLPTILHSVSEEKDRRNPSQNCPMTTLIQHIKKMNEQHRASSFDISYNCLSFAKLETSWWPLTPGSNSRQGAQMTETHISSNRFQSHCISGYEERKSSDISTPQPTNERFEG
jgi:hypothetical protein